MYSSINIICVIVCNHVRSYYSIMYYSIMYSISMKYEGSNTSSTVDFQLVKCQGSRVKGQGSKVKGPCVVDVLS